MNTAEQQQFVYDLTVSIDYFDTETKLRNNYLLKKEEVVTYEVSKDSVNFNYNLHLITLTGISQTVQTVLNLEDSRLNIKLTENSHPLSDTKFRIQHLHVIDDVDGLKNIQLLLVSEETYKLLHSSKYGKVSTLRTNAVDANITSFELLSQILQEMKSDYGTQLDTYYYDAGAIKNIHPSIRIPENLNDLALFDFIFKEFPPYLLNPYLIFDDFHFGEKVAPYNMIVNNICNLTGSYKLQNVNNIVRYNIGTRNFLGSKPLIDYSDVYNKLGATLMIKNSLQNRIVELKPATESKRSGEIIQLESNLDIATFKNKLYLQKRLADYEATIESYSFDNLNIKDITFMNVYNVTSPANYDHLPVCLKYRFDLGTDNTYSIKTFVDFVRVPTNLLAGS